MNGHMIAGSKEYNVGFIDSGTTFTYLPVSLFNQLIKHFEWYCSIDPINNCKGNLQSKVDSSNEICFSYDQSKYSQNLKEYFLSFPLIELHAKDINNTPKKLLWYPSEYLYREKEDQYCVAAEKFTRSNQILIGGTFMRQNNVIFDVEAN